MDVCILNTWRAYDLLLLAESVFELGLEERGDDGQLEVDNVLLEALRVPERDADSLAINFGLEEFGSERRVSTTYGGSRRRGSVWALSSWERERSAEKLDERRLAAALGANDKDAR